MMDLTALCLYCIFSLSLIVLSHGSGTNSDCRQCKPGYFTSRLCSDAHDTICSPCAEGTFTSRYNNFQSCSKCSKCDVGEFVSVPCSLHSDTVCESCSTVSDLISDEFIRACVKRDSPYSVSVISDLSLKDKDNKTRTFPIDYTIYEGSGVQSFDETNIVHDSHEEIVEGSGEIHFQEATATSPNETTPVPVVIIPDETEDKIEDIITKSTASNVTHTTTTKPSLSTDKTLVTTQAISPTVKEGIVVIDGGVQLNNESKEDSSPNVILKKIDVTPEISEITTTSSIQLLPEPEDEIVLGEITTKKKGFKSRQNEAIFVDVVETKPIDEPQFGASQTKVNSNGDVGGVSVGVFVAVCIICAAVFFVIGLMVNKYWAKRRGRSFNVEQAEKQNGKTFHDDRIEFKDPEKNFTTKTGIYDEIPADKQNGRDLHIQPSDADPVYSKPVKKPASSTGNNAKPDTSMGADNNKAPTLTTPAPENPVNEARLSRTSASIKYMDDEQTDEETDKLLPKSTSGPDEQVQPNTNTTRRSSHEELEESPTEITPMISVDNDTVNV